MCKTHRLTWCRCGLSASEVESDHLKKLVNLTRNTDPKTIAGANEWPDVAKIRMSRNVASRMCVK